MFGLFRQLGRARELRLLDEELRAAGLHPALVPEAVKMTMVRLMKQAGGVDRAACAAHAVLLADCLTGAEAFVELVQGAELAEGAERRLEAAIASGDSPDAQLVLLALHAGLVDGGVMDRFALVAD
ncbi:MAG: hypothetical protein RLQ26_00050 [Alphaproteobacteria bacterium]